MFYHECDEANHSYLSLELFDYKRNGRTSLMGKSQIALNKPTLQPSFVCFNLQRGFFRLKRHPHPVTVELELKRKGKNYA